MNIDVHIHCSPGTARRLAYVGLTFLCTGLVGIAHARLPVTFASAQKLTASQLNENFADLDKRLSVVATALEAKAERQQIPIITAWTPYVPSLLTKDYEPIANQASVGFYRRVGDSLEVRIVTNFSGAPQPKTKSWHWTLPNELLIDASANGMAALTTIGGGLAQQSNLQNFALGAYISNRDTVSASPASDSDFINETSPVAFDAGGQVTLYFTVPIKGWTVTQ